MSKKSHPRKRPLRLGYVALVDGAPLVMAKELGLFEKYGVNVVLSREVGWAAIRDKIIYGELDAAHAPAGKPGGPARASSSGTSAARRRPGKPFT